MLATASGLTLYVDGADSASLTVPVSACDSGCLAVWPIYNGNPASVPTGLSAADFSTFSNGGSTQSTYKGWPLYTHTGDAAVGQTTGDSVSGFHAVTIPFTAP